MYRVIYGVLAAVVIMPGCKVTSPLESQVSSIGIPESDADQDCLAWKTALLFSLNFLIHKGLKEKLIEPRLNNPDHPDYKNFTKPLPTLDVTTVLSVEKTRQLMDLIIEKEGGKCHKELLMDSQCLFHHPRIGPSEARFINGTLSYAHLSNVLDLSVDKQQVDKLDDFLKKYHNRDEAGQAASSGFTYHRFYCHQGASSNCAKVVSYDLASSLGICLLKKHQKLLNDRNLFDLSQYDINPDHLGMSMTQDSLQNFIDRSNQLSQ